MHFRLNTNTKMPSKDMKKFLHEFFNPPKATGGTQTKVKTGKKKVKVKKREREIDTGKKAKRKKQEKGYQNICDGLNSQP